jgi:hypothetical protein
VTSSARDELADRPVGRTALEPHYEAKLKRLPESLGRLGLGLVPATLDSRDRAVEVRREGAVVRRVPSRLRRFHSRSLDRQAERLRSLAHALVVGHDAGEIRSEAQRCREMNRIQ